MATPALPTHRNALLVGRVNARPPSAWIRRQGLPGWKVMYTVSGRAVFHAPCEHVTRAGELVLLEPHVANDWAPVGTRPWDCIWAHVWLQPSVAPLVSQMRSLARGFRVASVRGTPD